MKFVHALVIIMAALSSATTTMCGQTAATISGAGYSLPPLTTAVAPGQAVTFYIIGLKTVLTGPAFAPGLPLPTTLSGISVRLDQAPDVYQPFSGQIPLYSVQQVNRCTSSRFSDGILPSYCFVTAVTVQIPFELDVAPGGSPETYPFHLTVAENGVDSASLSGIALFTQVHILRKCDALISSQTVSRCDPVLTHADGSLVDSGHPVVKPGEVLALYAVGLGRTSPPVDTGAATPVPAPVVTNAGLSISFGSPLPTDVSIQFAGLAPGSAGLYQVNFVVPQLPVGRPACNQSATSNATLTLTVIISLDTVQICVGSN